MFEPHNQILWRLFSLAIASTLVVISWVYLRGWLALRSAFPNLIPGWRLAAFMSGLALTWVVVGSPLSALDHQLLTIHMVKHLLLMTVAAPLVLVGAPAFTLVCGLPKLFIYRDTPIFRLPTQWLKRCIHYPALYWLAGTAAVIGWHLPVAFRLGMRSEGMHLVEDLSFLLAGLLFWLPIVQSVPRAARSPRWPIALYLFLATLPCDVLSAFLVFCNRLVYPFYMSTPQRFSLAPYADQEYAGALMWVWVTIAYTIPAVAITIRMLSPSDNYERIPIRIQSPEGVRESPNDAQTEVL